MEGGGGGSGSGRKFENRNFIRGNRRVTYPQSITAADIQIDPPAPPSIPSADISTPDPYEKFINVAEIKIAPPPALLSDIFPSQNPAAAPVAVGNSVVSFLDSIKLHR